MEIGEFIKIKRKEKGISARELARRTGVSQPYLSQLETGKNNNPTSDMLRKIANGLGISYIELINEAGLVSKVDTLAEAFGFEPIIEKNNDSSSAKTFDLFSILNMNADVYFKEKLLTQDEKKKAADILKALFM